MDRGYDREFIIVDKTKLSGEEDQFKDATVFYHHPQNTMAEASPSNRMQTYFLKLTSVIISTPYVCIPHANFVT